MAKGNIKQSKSKDSTDPLTSVLKGGVGKASTAPVAKTKQMAKDVAKKVIPKAVESSDEDSEDDSEDSASDSEDSGSDSSDSEAEEKPKANGTSKAKGKAETSDDSASDSDSDSDDEVPAKAATNGTNGTKVNGKAAAPASPSTDSSDSDSEEDSGDEVKAAATKNIDTKTKVNGDAKDDESGSDDDSEDSSGSDEDSEDSEDSETETKPKEKAEAPSKKRKADADDEPVEKKAKMDTGSGSSTLWVGNLGWKVDDNVLYEEFKFCGDIVSARVVTDRESGRSRGFGYVDFTSHEAAQKAYDEKSGAYLEGRDMRLDFADKSGSNNKPAQSPGARAKKFGDTVSPESDTLFVGNLSFQADEDSVSAFFSDVANVKSLRLPTDQESGRMKGFGYVTFYSIEDAKKAFEALNGESCAGRNVRLDYSTPRPPREGGFGGRGGGRGGGDFGGRGGGRGRGGFGGRGGGRGGFNRGGGGGGFQGKKVSFD